MIDALSQRHWAISEQFANTFGVLALKLLSEGKSIEHLMKRYTEEDIQKRYESIHLVSDGLIVSTEWDRDSRLVVATTKYGQNVAIIPVLGALTKRGDLCSWGMRDYIGMIERANKSSKIAAIVLDVESPGGTVDGTNEFGMSIKQSKKPVVAFGDGMVASAAYWVASQAREIIANKNNATEFGSIGVLYVHENYQAYIAKEIGSVEIIRAPQSTDKARVNVIEPLTEDLRAEIKTELKEIAKEFFSTVKKGRGARLNTGEENIFTGKMYPANKALEMGMIDGLDTLQGAINRAGQLANSTSTSAPARAQVNTNMKFKSKAMSVLVGLGLISNATSEGATATAGATDNSAEALTQADNAAAATEAENARLSEANAAQATQISTLQAQVTELQAQVTTLTEANAGLQKTVDEQKAEIAKKPTGQITTVISKEETEAKQATDGGATKKGAEQYLTSIDAQVAELKGLKS